MPLCIIRLCVSCLIWFGNVLYFLSFLQEYGYSSNVMDEIVNLVKPSIPRNAANDQRAFNKLRSTLTPPHPKDLKDFEVLFVRENSIITWYFIDIFIHPWSPVTVMWQFDCLSISPMWHVSGLRLRKQHCILLKGLENTLGVKTNYLCNSILGYIMLQLIQLLQHVCVKYYK